jgi:hypothetical protein
MFGLIKELVPQNRLQKTLFKNLNKSVQDLNDIITLVQALELNKPYIVTVKGYFNKSIKKIVVFTGYNKESFKCRVLADEVATLSDIKYQYNGHRALNINFKYIGDFKEFNEDEAPLIVNWNYVSKEFKEKYFKSW